jgi:hypothetical protein
MTPYEEKLRHPKWQRRRLEIMELAGWQCEICGDTEEEFHIHHTGYSGREPWDSPDEELWCLCTTCHTLSHLKEEKIVAFLGSREPKREIVMVHYDELKDVEAAIAAETDPEKAIKLLKFRSEFHRWLRQKPKIIHEEGPTSR